MPIFSNRVSEAEEEAKQEISNEEVEEYIAKQKQPKTRTQKILFWLWDSFGKEPETRAYVNRLDAFLLLYTMYAYFTKYLDQSNVSNAYVSGMQQDLHMVGQDRNYMNTVFNMGYMTGSTLSVLFMAHFRPSIVLAICEAMWTICTLGLGGAKNKQTLYGLRFVSGLSSAAAFPGFAWVIGSWYAPDELAKRMTLFEMSACVGTMCSGYIQAGVYDRLRGKGGIKGWQWLFIVDGLISLPMCFLCYFCIPDHPSNTRAPWLKPKHRAFALKREKAFGRAPPRPFTVKRFLHVFTLWQFWCFGIVMLMFTWGNFATGYWNLWLQATHKYTVAQINDIPTSGSGLLLVSAYLYAVISDAIGMRWPLIMFGAVVGLVSDIILSVWDLPLGVIMFAQLFPFAADGGTSLSAAWIHETCQTDNETRGMMIGLWNTVSYGFQAWIPLVLFPTPDAPHYKAGYEVQGAFYVIAMFVTMLWWWMLRREVRLGKKKVNEMGLPVDAEPEVVEGVSVERREGSDEVTAVHAEPKTVE